MGLFRWVISLNDPGVPNWLDSGGNACGTILLRWQGLAPGVVPVAASISCEAVPVAELRKHLPATTRRISPAQRAARAAQRLHDYRNRVEQPEV